jgi:hypothetical protein
MLHQALGEHDAHTEPGVFLIFLSCEHQGLSPVLRLKEASNQGVRPQLTLAKLRDLRRCIAKSLNGGDLQFLDTIVEKNGKMIGGDEVFNPSWENWLQGCGEKRLNKLLL